MTFLRNESTVGHLVLWCSVGYVVTHAGPRHSDEKTFISFLRFLGVMSMLQRIPLIVTPEVYSLQNQLSIVSGGMVQIGFMIYYLNGSLARR